MLSRISASTDWCNLVGNIIINNYGVCFGECSHLVYSAGGKHLAYNCDTRFLCDSLNILDDCVKGTYIHVPLHDATGYLNCPPNSMTYLAIGLL